MSVIVQALDFVKRHIRHKVHKGKYTDEYDYDYAFGDLLASWTL